MGSGRAALLRWSALAGLAAIALAGCAFGDVTLARPHPSRIATSSRRGEDRQIVLVRPFASRRSEQRCGMKKNGYNTDTASVLCPAAPESLLADALVGQLSAAGFTVLADRRRAGPNTIVLTGVVDRLFVEPKLNYFTATMETDIGLTLTAKTAAGLVAERHFYVKGEEATMMAGQPDMQRAFESAVGQLVTAVVGAVANLADRFPVELGPPADALAPASATAAPAIEAAP